MGSNDVDTNSRTWKAVKAVCEERVESLVRRLLMKATPAAEYEVIKAQIQENVTVLSLDHAYKPEWSNE